MKPRQRLEQKQSSRLYLRKRDHRDVIMNDIYHNAIWMKKEQDGEEIDELVWCKYPKHALIGASGVENQGTITWMDVDRQFQYGYRQGNNMAQTFQLDNGIVVYVAQASSFRYRAYASLDGIVWKNLNIDDSVFGSAQPYHFADNALIAFVGRNPVSLNALVIDVDENGEIVSHVRQYTTPLNTSNCFFLCNTQSGCLFYVYSVPSFRNFNGAIYHLSENGTLEQRWIGITDLPLADSGYHLAYCNCGNKSMFVSATGWNDYMYATTWTRVTRCWTTDDDGYTWNNFEFIRQTGLSSQSANVRNDCCVRDGEFFVFYGADFKNSEVKCMASYTGTAWNEIELPSWVDLPTTKDGTCINPNVKETIRVAIRPNETQDYDITLFSLLGNGSDTHCLNRKNGNILFKDGKATDAIDEDVYFCFGRANGWRVFFDNKYLASSTKAFAWNQIKQQTSGYVVETIQPYDYCVWSSDYVEEREE